MSDPGFHRIRLTLHYDGRAFHGWQVQPEQRTVQGEVERVLSRLTNRQTAVVGSGRTDRGVHATGQVAAADVPTRWTAHSLRRAANALLPDDVWVADAALAPPYFHPRYDAASRSYVYRIGLAQHADSPFHAPWCWPLLRPMELSAMEAAAGMIVGDHSFKAFAKSGQEERGDRCTITEARWAPWEGLGLEFHVTANRFLHHMVRFLVGTMLDIGEGRRDPEVIEGLLADTDNSNVSQPAPPHALFLERVEYPKDLYLETE